ncbi:MAG: penicillin acylase family protein, partial [Halobacteriota archaeon]
FRHETCGDEFEAEGLDEEYYPSWYVLQTLPADSEWFDDRRTDERETRVDIAARAMNRTAAAVDEEDYDTYGEFNRLEMSHPFDRAFLNFAERPMDGSRFTVSNFRNAPSTQVGSSWRMVVTFGGESTSIVPGGNSGVFWSAHYDDQLDEWASGEYKPMSMEVPDGRPDIVFEARAGATDGSDDGEVTA